MHLKKVKVLKGKNGNEVVEHFSLPQTELDIMDPNNCLVSNKLDFATILTDFCDAKMLVYDSFRLGSEKRLQLLLFFFCGNLLSRLGLVLSASVLKNVPAFFCRISAEITAF